MYTKTTTRNKFFITIFFSLLFIINFANLSYAKEYKIIQLTNNNYWDESPQIHNGQVVWCGKVAGTYEIFLYDGTKTIQLTNNNYDDVSPQIHNGQVVWEGYINGSNADIFLYDGTKTIQLTNNNYDDLNPQIDNGQVVWCGREGGGDDWEIFLYDGTKTIQLTNNNYYDAYPQIHNGQVVWCGTGGGSYDQIFLYDGTKTIQLTNDNYHHERPQIHNGQVVWQGKAGGSYQIFLYDGTNTIQLTNNNYDHFDPQIHNGQVVWWSWGTGSGSGTEIFLYDGTNTTQLTNNNYDDVSPQIHNGQVVWLGHDGEGIPEIFLAVPIITVSGVIRYENKIFNETGAGDPDATEFKPVRFAKVEVVKVNGSTEIILGIDKTNEDGTYSVKVNVSPNDEVHLKCSAYQDNADYEIAVRECDPSNPLNTDTPIHFVTSSPITVSGDNLTVDLDISAASGEGGAFNIFDCFIEGANKIKELSGSTPPLVTVYWKEGSSVTTAYYGDNIIRVNGFSSEPDEYTDAAILHEYGHFIADKYSCDKSPGGTHRSNDTNQDIRLSLSEGWADFFQALCRNNPLFIIAVYQEDGEWKIYSQDIETLFNSYYGSLKNIATGQDTEVAVTSILWDIFDNPAGDDDPLGLGAQYIWNAFHNYITKDMDCVLEDFYHGWFSQNGADFYKNEVNNIFSSRSVFYSTPAFTRGQIFTKIDGSSIPDGIGESLNSLLNVSENLPIRNVNVFVDLPHEHKSDLLLTLVSPSGKEVILHKNQSPLSGQSEDIFAWYQPPYETLPFESLAKFRGNNAQGDWTLRVTDNLADNEGKLNRWKIEVIPNNPPQADSITPSSGTSNPGQRVNFTTTYSDQDGWEDIYSALFLVNISTSAKNCFYGYYNQNTNKLYLRDDGSTSWLGGFAPGSNNIIENSYAKLDCSKTTISGSGTTLTVKWAVTFKSPFPPGTKNTYLYVRDDGNAYSGVVQKGTWTIANLAPSVGTITPSSGSSTAGRLVKFTTTYTDPNSFRDIKEARLLVNKAVAYKKCLYVYYNQKANKLYLRNDANTVWLGGFAPGSANIIENSYAKLDCSQTTVSGSGNKLTVKWAIIFKSSFTGTKNTYLKVIDDSNASTGWIPKGTWKITP